MPLPAGVTETDASSNIVLSLPQSATLIYRGDGRLIPNLNTWKTAKKGKELPFLVTAGGHVLNKYFSILRTLRDGVKMLLWRFLTAGSYLLVDAGALWIYI